jgi:hypothetical protein
MASNVGYLGSVKIGTATVVGMGTWSMPGISTDQLDNSAFLDTWKTYLYGMKDGGTITFNGHLDMADVTGQRILVAANAKNSNLPALRFYMDATSYWVPNQTTDYLGPGGLSTGMGTPGLCSVNITAITIGLDKSGLGTVSFTAKVNGCMALV